MANPEQDTQQIKPWAEMSETEQQAMVIKAIDVVEHATFEGKDNLDDSRQPGARSVACTFYSREVVKVLSDWGIPACRSTSSDANFTRGLGEDYTLGHTFVLVGEENNLQYVVDLTFCQFVTGSGEIRHGRKKQSELTSDSPIAKQVLEFGFFRYTPENFKMYMNLLTDMNAPRKDVQPQPVYRSQRRFMWQSCS